MYPANHEIQLERALEQNADAFDSYFDNSADKRPVMSNRVKGAMQLVKSKGNPTFSAQFDIKASVSYFSVAAGVWTKIATAGVPAAVQVPVPVFLFGWNDFKSGFPKLKAAYPLTNWAYGRAFIAGYDDSMDVLESLTGGIGQFFPLDANALAILSPGDLVLPLTYNNGTQYVALITVHCTQVAYATLLESLVSDTFVMNMIRYVVPDASTPSLNQYANNIGIYSLSLFGKYNSDFVSPNSFKVPSQLQNSLIDIPLKKGIDKSIALASYLNYDCASYVWSTFVWTVAKHQA